MNPSPGDIRHVLVVRPDRLGDVILTLPVCAELRRRMPQTRVTMLVKRVVAPLLKNNAFVDDVVFSDYESGHPVRPESLARVLRRKNIDAAVVARPTPGIAWTIWQSGIPVRIGTGYRAYSFLFTHRIMEHRSDAKRHELEYNLRLLRPLGIDVPDSNIVPAFGILVDSNARRNVDVILESLGVRPDEPFVVLHPGSGNSARDWPAGRFADLGNAITHRGMKVIVTGTPADERKLRVLRAGMHPPVVSLAGQLDLPMLTALLARATVFVGNSTGPLHLAAALGTRVVSFYPPVRVMSAKRWGPYQRDAIAITGDGPVDCRKCVTGRRCVCVESITLETALKAVQGQLDQTLHQRGSTVA